MCVCPWTYVHVDVCRLEFVRFNLEHLAEAVESAWGQELANIQENGELDAILSNYR